MDHDYALESMSERRIFLLGVNLEVSSSIPSRIGRGGKRWIDCLQYSTDMSTWVSMVVISQRHKETKL